MLDEKTIDTLDFLYEQSLDEQLNEKDLNYIMDTMYKIANECEKWLSSMVEMTGEARMRFTVLKKMALDTVKEIGSGMDCLIHWVKMRDYIVTLSPLLRIFHKNLVDNSAAV